MVNLTLRVPAALLTEFRRLAEHEYDTPTNRLRSLMREDVRENRHKLNGSEQAA